MVKNKNMEEYWPDTENSWNCDEWQGKSKEQYESSLKCAIWALALMILFGIIYWILC